MNVIDIQQGNVLRSFIETTLGFGRPFDNKDQPSLFHKKENSFYYGINKNLYQASINIVDLAEWEKIHVNESGVQLHDVSENMLERIESFIDKHLAKQGYRLLETTKSQRSEAYLNIVCDTFNLFAERYRKTVDPEVIIRSSVSLRPVPDHATKHDMVLRLFVGSSFETGFVSMTIREAVKEVTLNITSEQKNSICAAIRAHLDSYGKDSELFKALDNFDISNYILNSALVKQPLASTQLQTLWSNYHAAVTANEVLFKGSNTVLDNVCYSTYKLVERTNGITPGSKKEAILVNAYTVATQLVTNYVNFNSRFA